MIGSDERQLKGGYDYASGHPEKDGVWERIDDLTTTYLRKLGSDPSGWDTLFQDPQDGRYWELVFPDSEYHGGGPPLLRSITTSEAVEKYLHRT
jgi:hypothetical protein